MGVLEDYDRTIRSLLRQYDSKKAQNRQIQWKIDALEESRRQLVRARDEAANMSRSVRREKIDSWWNGKLADDVRRHIDGSAVSADRMVGGINSAIGQIDGHIRRLRSDYDHIVGLMSSIEGAITSNRKARQKAATQMSASGGGIR